MTVCSDSSPVSNNTEYIYSLDSCLISPPTAQFWTRIHRKGERRDERRKGEETRGGETKGVEERKGGDLKTELMSFHVDDIIPG